MTYLVLTGGFTCRSPKQACNNLHISDAPQQLEILGIQRVLTIRRRVVGWHASCLRTSAEVHPSERRQSMKKWYCAVAVGTLLIVVGKANATPAVPEIDAGSAVTALGVLSGLIGLAAERLRRK